MVFVQIEKFKDYVRDRGHGQGCHFMIDPETRTQVFFGPPEMSVLIGVMALVRWDRGFAIYAVPDEVNDDGRTARLIDIQSFLVESSWHCVEAPQYGQISCHTIDDCTLSSIRTTEEV